MDASSLHDDESLTLRWRINDVRSYNANGCFTSARLLHFLSHGYTPACLKVRYRYVALSPDPVDGGGRRWWAGIPDTMMCGS